MEEIRESENPEENVVPAEMMPGFSAEESKHKVERQAPAQTELPTDQPASQGCCGSDDTAPHGHGKCCRIGHLVFDAVMLVAIIVLFILHFCGNRNADDIVPVDPSLAGNGDVVYVNIDTINEQYEMVALLTDSIESEKQRQTVIFQNRKNALETKLANYQRNMQSGQLTAQQAQYAESSLQQESEKLQLDYAQAEEDFAARYQAALTQIADSLKAATARVNKKYNASYVFSYGAGSPMICADPTKDITKEVLKEMNKPFSKKHKGGRK